MLSYKTRILILSLRSIEHILGNIICNAVIFILGVSFGIFITIISDSDITHIKSDVKRMNKECVHKMQIRELITRIEQDLRVIQDSLSEIK